MLFCKYHSVLCFRWLRRVYSLGGGGVDGCFSPFWVVRCLDFVDLFLVCRQFFVVVRDVICFTCVPPASPGGGGGFEPRSATQIQDTYALHNDSNPLTALHR